MHLQRATSLRHSLEHGDTGWNRRRMPTSKPQINLSATFSLQMLLVKTNVLRLAVVEASFVTGRGSKLRQESPAECEHREVMLQRDGGKSRWAFQPLWCRRQRGHFPGFWEISNPNYWEFRLFLNGILPFFKRSSNLQP